MVHDPAYDEAYSEDGPTLKSAPAWHQDRQATILPPPLRPDKAAMFGLLVLVACFGFIAGLLTGSVLP